MLYGIGQWPLDDGPAACPGAGHWPLARQVMRTKCRQRRDGEAAERDDAAVQAPITYPWQVAAGPGQRLRLAATPGSALR